MASRTVAHVGALSGELSRAAVGTALACLAARPWWTLAGAAVWPLIEYSAHRWVMHGAERWAPGIYRSVHGVHHERPRELAHFTIPIPVVVFVVGLLAGAGSVALGAAAPAAVAGLLWAYVLYDLAHLAAHGYAPFPGRAALARHHARHHARPAANFAVTVPAIDRLARTSSTTRRLTVVTGQGERAAQAFREAEDSGDDVMAIAPPGSPLAAAAGDRNMDRPGGVIVAMYADRLIDEDELRG